MEEDPYAEVMEKIKRKRSAMRGEPGVYRRAQLTSRSTEEGNSTLRNNRLSSGPPRPAIAVFKTTLVPGNAKSHSVGKCQKKDPELETFVLVREFIRTRSTDILEKIGDPAFILSLLREPLEFRLKLKVIGYLAAHDRIDNITVGEEHVVFDTPEPPSPRRLNIKVSRLTILAEILKCCCKTVVLSLGAQKEEIYDYINTCIKTKPCSIMEPELESIILSIRECAFFNFRMFISIYLKIQDAFLSRSFITAFITPDIAKIRDAEKDIITLAKAKELYRLFKRDGDYRVLKTALKLLGCKKNSQLLNARARIYSYIGDFYSAMECSRGTPNEYAAMALVNKDVAIERLQKKLGVREGEFSVSSLLSVIARGNGPHPPAADAPYFVLLAELCENTCPLYVYRAGIVRGVAEMYLGLVRYLKRSDPTAARALGMALMEAQCANGDYIAFEAYIAVRRLGGDYMSFLYDIRKLHNTPLIVQEIAYFEHRHASQLKDDSTVHLFLFKNILRRACNKNGCCADCRGRYSNMLESVYQFRDNGDFILLHFFVNNDLEIRKVAEHFEPEAGFYWPRLSRIVDFQSKMRAGIEMAIFDFCDPS